MIRKTEFIGKEVTIEYGASVHIGTIIDETKNLFHLKTKNKVLKLLKRDSILHISGVRP